MRVLSLLPASTEIVCALGAHDFLVGVTHECDFPQTVVRDLPRVTSSTMNAASTAAEIDDEVRSLSNAGEPLYVIDAELIARLAPDMIVTQALCDVCAVSENDVRALAARLVSKPEVVTLSGSTWDGVTGDITRVGAALGCPDVAAELNASLAVRLLRIHEKLREARAPRPRVVVVEWTDPVYAAGHWVPELVRRAGGREMMASAGEHSTVRTIEAIRSADPEILIIAPCGYDVERSAEAARELLGRDEWQWARSTNVWAMDSNALLSRPGPRLVDGAETLAAIMHPSLFGGPIASNAMRVAV
jgi:iron complex transport system substrate-binding protein